MACAPWPWPAAPFARLSADLRRHWAPFVWLFALTVIHSHPFMSGLGGGDWSNCRMTACSPELIYLSICMYSTKHVTSHHLLMATKPVGCPGTTLPHPGLCNARLGFLRCWVVPSFCSDWWVGNSSNVASRARQHHKRATFYRNLVKAKYNGHPTTCYKAQCTMAQAMKLRKLKFA